jgi:hypothetical protein
MKANFIRNSILVLGSAATLACTSCTTTGDPSTGGIFWSEQKAQGRLAERQSTLENIEKQTGKTERKSAETQHRIDALQ